MPLFPFIPLFPLPEEGMPGAWGPGGVPGAPGAEVPGAGAPGAEVPGAGAPGAAEPDPVPAPPAAPVPPPVPLPPPPPPPPPPPWARADMFNAQIAVKITIDVFIISVGFILVCFSAASVPRPLRHPIGGRAASKRGCEEPFPAASAAGMNIPVALWQGVLAFCFWRQVHFPRSRPRTAFKSVGIATARFEKR